MSTLFVMMGMPGAGKSTHAQQLVATGAVRALATTDAIRKNQRLHRQTFMADLAEFVRAQLPFGDVCVDTVNVDPVKRLAWLELAHGQGALGHLLVHCTPMHVCCERNWRRPWRERVPDDWMAGYAEQFRTAITEVESEAWDTIGWFGDPRWWLDDWGR